MRWNSGRRSQNVEDRHSGIELTRSRPLYFFRVRWSLPADMPRPPWGLFIVRGIKKSILT